MNMHYMYSSISPRKVPTTMISTAAPPFLASLYEILSKEDPAVIGWCDGGRAFGVYDFDAMERHILPTYFRHSKFASFQRQLNYFGFRKLQKAHGTDTTNIYCQPLFLRDDPSRMLLIKRKTYGLKTPPSSTPRRMSTPMYSFPTSPNMPMISRSVSEPMSYPAPRLGRTYSASSPSTDFDSYLASTRAVVPVMDTKSSRYLLYSDIPDSQMRLSIDVSMAEEFASIQMQTPRCASIKIEEELGPIPFVYNTAGTSEKSLLFSPDELDLLSTIDLL